MFVINESNLEPLDSKELQLNKLMAYAAACSVSFETVDWSLSACRAVAKERGAGVLDLFFSENLDEIREAKAICAQCPVAVECFALALANREPSGVWGGQLFTDGKPIAVKRPRGRPPKDPALRRSA